MGISLRRLPATPLRVNEDDSAVERRATTLDDSEDDEDAVLVRGFLDGAQFGPADLDRSVE